jgi:hypothetical protein
VPVPGIEPVQQLVVAALGDAECLPESDPAICGLAVVEDPDRGLAVHVPARSRGAPGRVEAWPQGPSNSSAAVARVSGALVARAIRATACG